MFCKFIFIMSQTNISIQLDRDRTYDLANLGYII